VAYLDKRGVSGLATVMFIIIALVSFAGVASIGLKAAESSDYIAEGSACKASLFIQTGTEILTFRTAESTNICETYVKEIKVERGDEYELMHFVADKLARSYWMINEGQGLNRDLWKRDGWTSDWACLMTYVIDVKQRSNFWGKDRPIEITRKEFVEFLENEIYPPKKDEDLTYADYLLQPKNMFF